MVRAPQVESGGKGQILRYDLKKLIESMGALSALVNGTVTLFFRFPAEADI